MKQFLHWIFAMGSLTWLPIISFSQCLVSTVPLQINKDEYKSRTSTYGEGTFLVTSDSCFLINVGGLDIVKVNAKGEIIKRIDISALDSIASHYIRIQHGPQASLRKHTDPSDALQLCQSTTFWFRGMRNILGSREVFIEISAIVNDGILEYGSAFSTILFTAVVDENLNVCSSGYVELQKELAFANSNADGVLSPGYFVAIKDQPRNDTLMPRFVEYKLIGSQWKKVGSISHLQAKVNPTTSFWSYLPAKMVHPEGALYFNGQHATILDSNRKVVKEFEVPHFKTSLFRQITPADSEFVSVSISSSVSNDGQFDPYYYVNKLDISLIPIQKIAKYDSKIYDVCNIRIKNHILFVLLYHISSERYLMQSFNLNTQCSVRTFK